MIASHPDGPVRQGHRPARRPPVGAVADIQLAHDKEKAEEAKAAAAEEEQYANMKWSKTPIIKGQATIEQLHRRLPKQTSTFTLTDSTDLIALNELQKRAWPEGHSQVDIIKKERFTLADRVIVVVDWEEIEYANPVNPAALGITPNIS